MSQSYSLDIAKVIAVNSKRVDLFES